MPPKARPCIDALYDRISANLVSTDDARDFLPSDKLDEIFTLDDIQDAVQELSYDEAECIGLADKIYHSARRIFAALIDSRREDLILKFISLGVSDSRLPLGEGDAEAIMDEVSGREFAKRQQWAFCPYTFPNKMWESHRHLDGNLILPFLDSEEIIRGDPVFVDRITISSSQQNFIETKEDVNAFRRRLKGNGSRSFDVVLGTKLRNLRLLNHRGHPSIIPFWGSYWYCGEVNLLFPYFDMTLHKFLAADARYRDFQWDCTFYSALAGLASALSKIDESRIGSLDYHGGLNHRLIGNRHLIQVSNILVSDDQFLLDPFGLDDTKPDQEFPHTQFGSSKRSPDYQAPENDLTFEYPTRAADTWAFGCLMTEVVTYMLEGAEGLTTFRKQRTTPGRLPLFSDAHFYHPSSDIKVEVVSWMKSLQSCDHSSYLERMLMELCFHTLQPDPRQRPSMAHVHQTLVTLSLRKYFQSILDRFAQICETESPHASVAEVEEGGLRHAQQMFMEWGRVLGLDGSSTFLNNEQQDKVMGYLKELRVVLEEDVKMTAGSFSKTRSAIDQLWEHEPMSMPLRQPVVTVPPTDSGYASTSAVNAKLAELLTLGDHTTLDSLQGSVNESFNDTATVYSDDSSTTPDREKQFIRKLAENLASETLSLGIDEETQTRVRDVLPSLLGAFALKVGCEGSSPMHRGIMSLVHRRRREIAKVFAEIRFRQADEEEEKDTKPGLTDLNPAQPKNELIRGWLKGDDYKQPLPGEHPLPEDHYGEGPKDADPSNDHNVPEFLKRSEETGDCHEGDDLVEFDFQMYCEFLSKTQAFQRLLAGLRAELQLVPMKPQYWEPIGKKIISNLPYTRKISKRARPQSYRAKLALDWDIHGFFKAQGYLEPPHKAFKDIVALTGSCVDAQAATCGEYLAQTWPSAAEDMILLMERVLRWIYPLSAELSDGTKLNVRVEVPFVIAEVEGVATAISEVADQLAWLGAALRSSTEQSEPIYCTPRIETLLKNDSPSSKSDFHVICDIGFKEERIQETSTTNGQCWWAIFRNPVIVRGYPILQRTEWRTGLEIPLPIMARLAWTPEIQQFNSYVCIKGFSSMLVPVLRRADILYWHLLYKKDGSRISYLDNDLDQKPVGIGFDLLENSRHILGWCPKAMTVLGSSVKHSMLPKPKTDGALVGKFVPRGRPVKGYSTVCVGASDSSQLFSDGYVKKLHFLKNQFILLWDKDDQRGWLVSGTVALLFVLQEFLTVHYEPMFGSQHHGFQVLNKPLTAMAAFRTLSDRKNRNLTLYGDRTTLGSKIEDLYSLFEHLIDLQTEIATDKLNGIPRGNLEGWEFEDIAGMEQNTLHPRVAKVESKGKGWVDFTRAIQAVTLFGCGFGEIIKPTDGTCRRWATLPTKEYYIATCISDIRKVFKEHGFPGHDKYAQLGDNLIWHTPTKCEFCQCSSGSDSDGCEPVQTTFPLDLAKSESLSTRENLPKEEGALIFGHNSQFLWFWGDLGHPKKGQCGETALETPADSGIGPSLATSESEGQTSSFSKSNTRHAEYPNDTQPETATPLIPKLDLPIHDKGLYTVGILCALPKELKAIRALFDETHQCAKGISDDHYYRYVFGRISHHMVVARCLPRYGTNEAALVANDMKHEFDIRFCLLVGIGGGVPSQESSIRLGDVVFGEEVVQYDLGHRENGVFMRKAQSLPRPPDFVISAIMTRMTGDPNLPVHQIRSHLRTIFSKIEMPQSCDGHQEQVPKMHYGKIASGNQVIKDAKFRDTLAAELGVKCFEMEAAGVVMSLPCLVIRGICDFCDDRKNDTWQDYAAATAAAYAKLLLTVMDKRVPPDDSHDHYSVAGHKRRRL